MSSSSSAVPHAIAFLTRPLLSKFTPSAVTAAQLILHATLSSMQTATFTFNDATHPPPALKAASVGSGIPWADWFTALGGGSNVLMFYGPGYLKVRIGDAPVKDIWCERPMTTQQGVLPTMQQRQSQRQQQPTVKGLPNPLLQENTSARLRAILLSAQVRNVRREQAAAATSPLSRPSTPDSSSDSSSDSDSDSESDCGSTTSSQSSCYSESDDCLPVKTTLAAAAPKPQLYRPPQRRPTIAIDSSSSKKPTTTTATYMYQGGVTRVMTGGVMLGSHRPSALVVRSTRS